MRTTFTEEQLQVLQANFEVDSNPDGQDLERIAQITGMINQKKQNLFISLRKIGLRFYFKNWLNFNNK